MGRLFMFMIGLAYLGAATAYLFERKWLWASVALAWGIGNLCLSAASK